MFPTFTWYIVNAVPWILVNILRFCFWSFLHPCHTMFIGMSMSYYVWLVSYHRTGQFPGFDWRESSWIKEFKLSLSMSGDLSGLGESFIMGFMKRENHFCALYFFQRHSRKRHKFFPTCHFFANHLCTNWQIQNIMALIQAQAPLPWN